MKALHRTLILLTLSLAAAVSGCGGIDPSGPGPDVERALGAARDSATAWIAAGRGTNEPDARAAIALGYLERQRLGLGSPFRLMDFALNDPRLDPASRRQVAWALLARTLDRQGYQIDPSAFDGVGATGPVPGAGRRHLDLIEGAVSEARDPRGGELAVRMGYTLAAAEGVVTKSAVELAAGAAALVRDRLIARADAERLLRAAAEQGVDPLALLPVWRAERRFEVERPVVVAPPLVTEREAVELAPRLAEAIRGLGVRIATEAPVEPTGRPGLVPLLGPIAAERLSALADSLDMPPQTAIGVAIGIHRRELLRPGIGTVERGRRARFIDRATNEERFAAEYALLLGQRGHAPGEVARVALRTAVGLRPFAQETVWFPGAGGPSSRELEDRFGLAFVRFDDDVPATWRPFYRRVLADALSDMHRVLPALDLRGLGIRFGQRAGKAATLAVHDPRQRTIYLPPETGAGTIAHEIAHDLDWQVALRRYRVRGDYASDRATRRGTDRLARAVERLSASPLIAPIPGDTAPVVHHLRPAEVFARSMDWFVVVALAREGRMNGYLSSVQDDLLTGYGTVTPPDVTGEAGLALVSILDEIAPLYPETREWFLRNYGPGRAFTAYDLVRLVVERSSEAKHAVHLSVEPVVTLMAETRDDTTEQQPLALDAAGVAARYFEALTEARDAALAAIDDWTCQQPSAAYDTRLESARRRLVARATAARGRGLALEVADDLAGPAGRRWLARRLFGGPWPTARVDATTETILESLAEQARRVAEVRIPSASGSIGLVPAPRACGPLPGIG